jgi:tRNA pseudouridine synthase 10
MELIELYHSVQEYGEICDHCLGRLVAKRSHGLSNDMRGKAIRIAAALEENVPYVPHAQPCWICNNFFDATSVWASRVVAALDGIECKTFLLGSKVPPLIAEAEEMVWSDLSLHDIEPLKSEINREVGKAVSALNGLKVELKTPDVVVVLNIHEESTEVQIRPVFLYGRYSKFERGIPQTHWHCRSCRGAGCDACNGTGKQYADSVEELIGRPLCRIFEGTAATLHGAGREDIDAVMIGSGRPFIIEISEPRIRHADLTFLEEEINRDAAGRVSVKDLRWTERGEVETLKNHKGHKKYRILVDIDGSIPEETLSAAVDQLKGATIHQRTPTRVAHRRADKIRERVVLDIICADYKENLFTLEVSGEAGLYIKELISGDQGRTKPSLSEILGTPARVVQLDVIDVQGTELGD